MTRCYNFCAGPASLPEPVLETARDDLLDWHGKGLSLMEMSHRSPEVVGVAQRAEQTLRDLLDISDDYAVLFLQGGASTQFSAVPLNLLGDKGSADYINTGQWSKKAIAEAKRYCDVNVAASSEATNFSTIPPRDSWQPGSSPPSYDKQFVRDYLETLDWNKQAPGPLLPADIIEASVKKYAEACQILTQTNS